jgi:hypothetical protein
MVGYTLKKKEEKIPKKHSNGRVMDKDNPIRGE